MTLCPTLREFHNHIASLAGSGLPDLPGSCLLGVELSGMLCAEGGGRPSCVNFHNVIIVLKVRGCVGNLRALAILYKSC